MKIYAVDIDGTLCEEQNEWWKYSSATPVKENIEKVNRLYEEGNTIVIFTARFSEDREVTTHWLKKNGVKFHKMVMDKFRADVYIDSAMKKPEEL